MRTTLRPGYMVALKTSTSGNVSYLKSGESEQQNADGSVSSTWETTRIVADPNEHKRAVQVRSRVRSLIRSACAKTAFCFICPLERRATLDANIEEARSLVKEFNNGAVHNRVEFNILIGEIAPTDVEAIRAINSEVRDLMQQMAVGIGGKDAEAIRDAADRAKQVAEMLQASVKEVVDETVAIARKAASGIAKAQRNGTDIAIDKDAIKAIKSSSRSFIDFAEDVEPAPAAPKAGRSQIDLESV